MWNIWKLACPWYCLKWNSLFSKAPEIFAIVEWNMWGTQIFRIKLSNCGATKFALDSDKKLASFVQPQNLAHFGIYDRAIFIARSSKTRAVRAVKLFDFISKSFFFFPQFFSRFCIYANEKPCKSMRTMLRSTGESLTCILPVESTWKWPPFRDVLFFFFNTISFSPSLSLSSRFHSIPED